MTLIGYEGPRRNVQLFTEEFQLCPGIDAAKCCFLLCDSDVVKAKSIGPEAKA